MRDTQKTFARVSVFIFNLCLSWHSLHALEPKEAQAVVKK